MYMYLPSNKCFKILFITKISHTFYFCPKHQKPLQNLTTKNSKGLINKINKRENSKWNEPFLFSSG